MSNAPRARSERPTRYPLSDPKLRAYDHGLGTLRVDGELKGYLASIVGELRPSGDPWPWFIVVWADGTRELPFEDYGPWWTTVRELDAGRFDDFYPSARKEHRFLGMRVISSIRGAPRVYDFAWLPTDEAASRWKALGLADSDF